MLTKELEKFMQKARQAQEEGHERDAEALYRKMHEAGVVEASLELAKLYVYKDRVGEAEAVLETIGPELGEEDQHALSYVRGIIAYSHDRYQEALALFKPLYEGGDDYVLGHVCLCYQGMGEMEKAEALAQDGVRRDVDVAYEVLGDLLMVKGDAQGALAQMQCAYERNRRVSNKVGLILLQLGRHGEAIPYLREALRQPDAGERERLAMLHAYFYNGQYRLAVNLGKGPADEGRGDYSGLVGMAYALLDEHEEAVKYFRLAIKRKECKDMNLHTMLSRSLFKLERWEETLKALNQAKNENDHENWYIRGCVYQRMGNLGSAIRCFRRSTECENEAAGHASYELGMIYKDEKNIVKAMSYFQDAWSSGFAPASFQMGLCEQQYGDKEIGVRWLRLALEGGIEEAAFWLGFTYMGQGKKQEAREMFLLSLEKKDERARLGLAMLAVDEKNREEAAQLLEECAERNIPGTNLFYGLYSRDIGDVQTAEVYLLKAWEEDHDKKALMALSDLYLKGPDSMKNMKKSDYFLHLAVENRAY